jgi:hypothetical protein
MTWNLFFTLVDMVGPILTRFWPENSLKLIFYPGRHGLTRIDSVDSVLTENDGFDPKTAWNSFFTLVDMVWPVLTRWTRFWSKMTVLTWNGLKLIFYSGRHVLTRIDSVDSVLTENDGFDPKTHFLLGRHGLTCIDPVESVLMERCGWLEKNIFLNFPFS